MLCLKEYEIGYYILLFFNLLLFFFFVKRSEENLIIEGYIIGNIVWIMWGCCWIRFLVYWMILIFSECRFLGYINVLWFRVGESCLKEKIWFLSISFMCLCYNKYYGIRLNESWYYDKM